jgi:hypothetical protein
MAYRAYKELGNNCILPRDIVEHAPLPYTGPEDVSGKYLAKNMQDELNG